MGVEVLPLCPVTPKAPLRDRSGSLNSGLSCTQLCVHMSLDSLCITPWVLRLGELVQK